MLGKKITVAFFLSALLFAFWSPDPAFSQPEPPALGGALRFGLLSLSPTVCPAPQKGLCGRIKLGPTCTIFKTGVLTSNIGAVQEMLKRGLFVGGDVISSADAAQRYAVRLGSGVVAGEVVTAGGEVLTARARTKVLGGIDTTGTSPKLDALAQAIVDAAAAADAAAALPPTQSFPLLVGGETVATTVPGLNVIKVGGIVMRPKGQTLTLSGSEDDIMVINVEKDPGSTDARSGVVRLAAESRIELEGGLAPNRVLINIIGPEPGGPVAEKIVKIGRKSVLQGTILAKDRHVRMGQLALLRGALIAGGEIRASRLNTVFFASFFPSCGNGIIDQETEQCDGDDLGGETCESQGFPSGGTLRCSEDCRFDFSGCGQVKMGAAASFAVLATNSTSVSLDDQVVALGDVGGQTVGAGNDIRVQGDVLASAESGVAVSLFTGFVGDDVVTCGGSIVNVATVIGGSTVVDPTCTDPDAAKLLQARLDAQAVAADAAALPPQLTLGIEDGDPPLTISVPGSGLKVVEIAGIVEPPAASTSFFTIEGSATDIFVINVTGEFTLASDSTIGLTGGITPDRVLVNIVGPGSQATVGTNSFVGGTILGVERTLRAKNGTTVAGALIAAGPIETDPDAAALGNSFVGF